MKRLFFKWDNLAATIFIFMSLAILYAISINLNIFNPFYKAFSDFHYTDLIYSKYQTHKKQDTNIVLINIGNLDREGIAKQIENIQKYKPAVIALDAIFRDRKDNIKDSLLHDALANSTNLVLACDLNIHDFEKTEDDHIIYSNPYFGNFKYGFYNLVGDSLATKRYFRPHFNIGTKSYNSFAAEIVKAWNFDVYSKLEKRNKDVEVINYIGNFDSYIYFDTYEIFNNTVNLNILKDKIVIMGFMGDKISKKLTSLADAHITPMNTKVAGRTFPDAYGVVIHANIVSTIIRNDYINSMSVWLTWLIAFLICFFHVGVFLYYYVENYRWLHIVAKLLQLVSSVLILYFVFLIYNKFNYKINSTPTIVSILLSVDLLYFYDGFLKIPWIHKKFGKSSYIAKHHENK